MHREIPPRELRVGVWTPSEEILGHSLGYGVIPKLVARLDVRGALMALAQVSRHAERAWSDPDTQIALARHLLSPSTFERAKHSILDRGRSLFFPQQVLVLMKYIARYGRVGPDNPTAVDDELHFLGPALLAVSDLLTAVTQRTRRQIVTINPVEDLTFDLFLSAYYPRSPALLSGFVRPRQMCITIPSDTESLNHPDYIDLEKEFLAATGVSIRDYLVVGVGILAYFLRPPKRQRAVKS